MLGDLLTDAPARLQQQLYEAFDLQALYKKNMHQVTIHITITDSTPRAVAAIIDDAGDQPPHITPDPGEHAYFSDLSQTSISESATTITSGACSERAHETGGRCPDPSCRPQPGRPG
jgi:hypothetical protein